MFFRPSNWIDDSQPTQTGNRDKRFLDPGAIDLDSSVWDFRSPSAPHSHSPVTGGLLQQQQDKKQDKQQDKQPVSTVAEERDPQQLLARLQISRWTTVDIPNDLAAKVILLYLETDHPLLGLFEPSLFISDLVNGRDTFCSALLVNSLLYLSCQMYSALNKQAARYIEDFRQVVQDLQRKTPCHSNEELGENESERPYLYIASMVLLSVSLTGHGKDHEVIENARRSCDAAREAGYLTPAAGDPPSGAIEVVALQGDHGDRRCAAAYAAWGAFNWSVIISLFYRQPEISWLPLLPSFPVPGKSVPAVQQVNTWDGSTANLEQDDARCSVFPALCELWRMVHVGSWIYYDDALNQPQEPWRHHLAEHKVREIIAWTNRLPQSLCRGKETPSCVAVFHIWLHLALLDFIRPFASPEFHKQRGWNTFSAKDRSVSSAYSASVHQLKRLLVDFRANYEASTYSILWHTGLLYLVNAMLEGRGDPDWYIFTSICIHGYETLRRPYRISEAIGKALLTMALQKADMDLEDARKMSAELEDAALEKAEDQIRATFVGDLELALRDPESARVEYLASELEHLVLFSEVINEDQMQTDKSH